MIPHSQVKKEVFTSRQLKNRLEGTFNNVALRVEETDSPDRFSVSGEVNYIWDFD